ncbi:formate/nitrite transporter family protein [Paenibacillus sp. sgz302251]|uniref:formate/nitrite transporter family protein n=1 Tax=Paenibacillus sp. sgz302251 TaxID=3414493 RepID=UPI003C7E7CCB
MAFHTPRHIAELTMKAGERKASLTLPSLLVLGFLAGAFIAFGFLVHIRVSANLPDDWGSFASFLGAAVFPVGLILVIIAGGELVTGNMMSLSIALMSGKITVRQLLTNWFWVTLSNFVGAVFVAYCFGHVVGLTETGPYLEKTVAIAQARLDDTFLQAFISAIGCNWLVALAVWLSSASDDVGGKILGIWFPIMTFVAIGFQHVVANMFVIPAAIFAGSFTWIDYFSNFVPVFLGNLVGGAVFVAAAYWFIYIKDAKPE